MNRRDWSLLVFLSLLWGGSFLFNELALQGFPVMTVVWLRVAGAAGLLALWLRLRGLALPRGVRVWGALAVMGTLNNAVPFTLFVLAQTRIEGGMAAVVNATTPLWTVLVAHALTDERLTRARVAGVLVGFAGVVVMAGGQAGGTTLAILMCLGAALSYAFAGVWGRRFRALGLVPEQTAFGQVAAASVLLAVPFLMLDRPWSLPAPGLVPVLAVLGLAALATALAYILYFRLLASAGATNLSLVTFLIPVSAMGLGVAVLAEAIGPRQLSGFALILVGLAILDGRLARRLAS